MMDPHRRPSGPYQQHPPPPQHSQAPPNGHHHSIVSPVTHDHRLQQPPPQQAHQHPQHPQPIQHHPQYQPHPGYPPHPQAPLQHHPQQQQPPSQQTGPPPQHPHYAAAPSSGPSLPPIGAASENSSLPPIRHPSAQHQQQAHDPREASQEYPPSQYPAHNRSGHATPAGVNRTYSNQDRTPTTPSVPQPFAPPPPQHQAQQQPQGPPPPGPEFAAPPPPPHVMDHGAHQNVYAPNGVPMGAPGAPPPQPGPPPPQHHDVHGQQYMQPMMDHHQQYAPAPAMYGAPNYGPTSNANYAAGKRKQMRATQACEQCRARKQKCDEGSPCSFCKEQNLACQYRDTPPAKTDKNMEKLLQFMETNAERLEELTSVTAAIRKQFDSVERRLGNLEANGVAPGGLEAADREALIIEEEEEEMRRKRKPRIDDHRTAPHKLLLLWPSVRPLMQEANIECNDGYVMEAEDRGMLRLWTVGEAIDEMDGTQGGGPASPARSDGSGDGTGYGGSTSGNRGGKWGNAAAFRHGSPDVSRNHDMTTSLGGRRPNGELDLDVNTIRNLFESYMRHIHIMHPFLDKRRLKNMFDQFSARYGTGRAPASFAVGNGVMDVDTRPMKRQKSNGATPIGMPRNDSEYHHRREPIERSPANAVIFLVMALGKICAYKDPLPGPVLNSKLQINSLQSHAAGIRGQGSVITSFAASSPGSMDMKPSPISPNQTPNTQPTPPSENGHRFDPRRGSTDVGATSAISDNRKNQDVLPGLAYYAKAAEILGEQGDGNDLVHAQMFLLAGLYKGQLARVKESMSWITMAGRAILTLLDRYKLYNDNYWTAYGDVRKQHRKNQARIKDTRQALIVLASWTCLQLETDILAEMKLPPSGIQSMEALLLMPHKSPEDESYAGLEPDGRVEDYDNILMYYCAQLFLRRRLNKVHQEIYGPDCIDQPLAEVEEMLKGHETILAGWRESLPPNLAWEDDEPPPTDILSARLRGKYYGARYVINRPFLDYALHIMPHLKEGYTVERAAVDAHGNPRHRADVQLFKAIQRMGDSEIWQAVKRCIDSAMKSTIAFDGMADRLVVTNIHGTAHAQFGNMLVLSASFHSSYLRTLVPEAEFKALLLRTIGFLRKLSPISPTCQMDCQILEKFNNTLFPVAQDEPLIYRGQGLENEGGNFGGQAMIQGPYSAGASSSFSSSG